MIFSYMIKRLRRHPSEAIVSAAIVLVIVVFLIGLLSARADLLADMDRAYETIEIRCRVTSANNSREYSLPITEDYVKMLTEEEGVLYPYVKDVFLLETYPTAAALPPDTPVEHYYGAPGMSVELHMTNDPESYTLKEGAEFEYLEGYSSASFAGDEPICMISHTLKELVGEDGTVIVRVAQGSIAMKMKVIGTYGDEKATVFGAWQPLLELISTLDWKPNVGSMAFTIADNRKLDVAKTILRDYYVPASKLNNDSVQLGLIVDDSLFVDTVTVYERSLSLLKVVQTMVYVLSIGISFLVAYLNIRARRLELAVMRSLGTRSIALYAEVLSEHTLFFLIGGLLATVGAMLFGIMPGGEQMKTVGTFMLCYLFGVAIAVAQATSGKIMQTLKGKE